MSAGTWVSSGVEDEVQVGLIRYMDDQLYSASIKNKFNEVLQWNEMESPSIYCALIIGLGPNIFKEVQEVILVLKTSIFCFKNCPLLY